ncbi:MAG TPA: alpha-amylase family glycosyl hydrolase, partial [Flexilinea sp.]|nr:alpha-amylase family glycosyl hydrolase [Flexilinea sp.]
TGIDGWRLDVADEMEMSTLQTIRMVLKEKYPDILLLGETWGDAFRLVGNGDQMDSAMNYLFRNAVLDWIAKGKIRATNFDRRINQLLSKYNDLTNSVMYNLIGSHDTARFLSEAGENKNKLKLAAAFQMTFCGSPAVYYGDEIGMSGENDPGCRAGMIWDQESQDRDLFQWYRCFIELRKAHPALRKGTFRSNFCDDEKNIYGFIRQTSDEALFVLMNNSENCSEIILPVPDRDAEYRELFSSMIRRPEPLQDGITFYNQEITEYQGQLSIPIDAYSVQIYKKEK